VSRDVIVGTRDVIVDTRDVIKDSRNLSVVTSDERVVMT